MKKSQTINEQLLMQVFFNFMVSIIVSFEMRFGAAHHLKLCCNDARHVAIVQPNILRHIIQMGSAYTENEGSKKQVGKIGKTQN